MEIVHRLQRLYLIEILHQTTTGRNAIKSPETLYLIEILHQTTTSEAGGKSLKELYLIEILHQTTTGNHAAPVTIRCILSKFYIKPQRLFNEEFWNYGCILSKFYIKPQRRASY